jgi:membrane-bound serine protease (ClpP class)
MSKRLIGILCSLAWLCLCCPSVEAAHVNVIELDNQIISPVTQQYIVSAVDRSERDGAQGLILILDTPGGLLESTRAIVKRIMNARVPIVVYVAPSGARAGSAGVFITLAAHIAAMAPSTNIGAAHPVDVGGGGPVKKLIRRIKRAVKNDEAPSTSGDRDQDTTEEEIVEEEEQSPMADKIMNDTVAWITTIARTRHRNEDWAKKAVTESFSITEDDAVKERIVEVIAKDLDELLAKIDGWPVDTLDGAVTLSTAGAEVRRLSMTARERFLAVITNPNIAYLLMMLGTLGLIFEFTHPGIGFPGIAGLICVILAMFAFQTLPINYAAIALLIIGLLLLIAEVKVAGFGLLALGGVVSLTLGSLMLFDSPEPGLHVSLRVIIPVVGTLAAIILFLVQRVLKAQAQAVSTGAQGLVGEVGEASTDVNPDGKVFVHGELWNASSAQPIQAGERIRVISVEGLRLRVERE